ncbi:MAG TPA: hypothetical protein VLO07_04580 [Thermoanaerobaculia bacterium]|nr:hypothetical protein [Thermoanaerobaculia bacterium]
MPAPPVIVVGIVVLLAALAGLIWFRARTGKQPASARAEVTPSTPTLDLTGRWQTQVSETLPGPPPRPVLKDIFLETNREGAILAAGVLLTDPGRGGAGAGYRLVSDGPRRVADAASLLASTPAGSALAVDFIPFPAWVPARNRLWRALEGQSRRGEQVRYLLLESVEDDYLVQIGINQSGFLSYAFFSPAYASGRGVDTLSRVIHPEAGSSLRAFQNLVWDLSGAADFLNLEVYAKLSGPEGIPNRLTLRRK